MNAGCVVYNIEYETNGDNDFVTQLMPKDIIMKFKDNKISILSSIAFGQITGNMLLDTRNKSAATGISYAGKNHKIELQGEDVKFNMFNFNDYKIIDTDKSVSYMGLNCKVLKLASIKDTFEVHYTNDIAISDIHWNGTMKEIPGVPLKYRMIMNGINATATPKEIYACEFPDSDFELDDKYITASKEKMNSIFKLFD